MVRRCTALLAGALLLTLAVAWSAVPARAQIQEGATLTVLRGQVAVVHPDGSAVQPAPSGTVVNAGDEIRTLTAAGALITFFAGTEIEMGAETILAVEQVSRQGERVDISLKQVAGSTVNRVTHLTETGSSYRIEAGGAVALVRGTTFIIVGPITTTSRDVVVLVCLDDCDARSTFAGCPLAPFLGYFVAVAGGRLESGCQAFAVAHGAGLYQAAFEAVTTAEQHFQGDTHGRSAGTVQGGQRNQIAADRDRKQDDEKDNDGGGQAAQGGDAGLFPSAPPPIITPGSPSASPSARTGSGVAGLLMGSMVLGSVMLYRRASRPEDDPG